MITTLEKTLSNLLTNTQLIQLQKILDFFSYTSAKSWYEKHKHEFQEEIDYSSKFNQLKKEYQKELAQFLVGLPELSLQLDVMEALIANGKEDFVLTCIELMENNAEPRIQAAIEKSFVKMSLPAQKVSTQYLINHGGPQGYKFLNEVAAKNKKISAIVQQSLKDDHAQNEIINYIESMLKDSLKPIVQIEPSTLLFYLKSYYQFNQRVILLRKLWEAEPEQYKAVYRELLKAFEGRPKPSNPKKEYVEEALLVLLCQDNLGIPIKQDLLKQYIAATPEEKKLTFPDLSFSNQQHIVSLSLDGTPIQKQWILHYLLNNPELAEGNQKTLKNLTQDDSIMISALASTLLLKEAEHQEKRRLQTIIATYLIREPKDDNVLGILFRYLETLPPDIMFTIDLLSKELQAHSLKFILALPKKEQIFENILNSMRSISLEETQWLISLVEDTLEENEAHIALLVEKLTSSMNKEDLNRFLVKNPLFKPYIEKQLLYRALREGLTEDIDWQNPVLFEETNYITNNLVEVLKDQMNQCLASKPKELDFIYVYQDNEIILKLLNGILAHDLKTLEKTNSIYLDNIEAIFKQYEEASLEFFAEFMKKVRAVIYDENDESYIMLEGYIEELTNQLESLSTKDFMSRELPSLNQFAYHEKIDLILADYRRLQLEIRFLENKLTDPTEKLSLHFISQFAQSIEKIQMLLAKDNLLLESELLDYLMYWIRLLGIEPLEPKLGIPVDFNPDYHLGSGFELLNDPVFVLTSGFRTPSGTVIKQVLVTKEN